MDSRTRYFFYKEQLLKELRLQQQQPTSIPPTSQSLISLNTGGASFNEQSQSVMRVDLTQLSRPKKESDTMVFYFNYLNFKEFLALIKRRVPLE